MNFILYIFFIFIFNSQIKSNESTKQSKNYPPTHSRTPLKVISWENGKNYELPSKTPPGNVNPNYKFLCPMSETDIPEEIRSEWKSYSNCLKPVDIQPGEQCKKSFSFSTIRVDEKLPEVDVFIFHYEVCDVVQVEDENTVKSDSLEIYKVYANRETKQALHAEYRIISQNYLSPPDSTDYIEDLKLTHYTKWLQELPRAYKKQNPKFGILNSLSSKMHIKSQDYLVPQMLVPSGDLDPTNAREAHLNYLNIRPQYERLQATWNNINQSIRHHLYSCKLHRSTTIYTSASNILKHKRRELKIKVNKDFHINVPYVWWHLIRTDDEKAIIIIFYNVPLDYSFNEIDFICEPKDICKENGWKGIYSSDDDKKIYVQCCKATDHNLENLNFIKTSHIKINEILNLEEITIKNERTKQQIEAQELGDSGSTPSRAENNPPTNENIKNFEGITKNHIFEVSTPDEKESFDFVTNEPLSLSRKENEKHFTFDRPSLLDTEPGSESLVKGCPDNILDTDCIHVSSSDVSKEKCPRKVQPNLSTSETSCIGGGVLYTFQYNVCYNTNMNENEMKFAETPMLYSVCYNKDKKETIYTTHKILTDTLKFAPLDAKIYKKRLQTYGDTEEDFKYMAITFEEYLGKGVVPQLLVPLFDMDQDYVRGANFHYLNIRPQYKRIANRWNEINAQILQYLLITKLYKDVTIYTGTALKFSGSASATTPKIELRVENTFPISMPVIWAKVIVSESESESEMKSIVILIYNIPYQHYLKDDEHFCEESICAKTNWLHTESDKTKSLFNNNVHVHCCQTNERILFHLRLPHISGKFNGKFPIFELPKELIPKVPASDDEIRPA